MTLFAFLITLVVMIIVGKALLRSAGWPTSPDAALKWLVTLFVLAVIFSSLPAFLASLLNTFATTAVLPQVGFFDVTALLLVSGLAVVGYAGWTRGELERMRGAEPIEHRERMLPPPPSPEDQGWQTATSKVDDPATTASEAGPVFRPRPSGRRSDGGVS